MRKLKVMFLGILFLMVNIVLLIESPYYLLVHPITICLLSISLKFRKLYPPYIIEVAVGIPWMIVFIIYFSDICELPIV